MNDFAIIQNHGWRFTPEDVLRLHTASRKWLANKLMEPFGGKTVVVTHHAASSGSVSPQFVQDPLSPAFVSNLEELMSGDRVPLWIHGHTHYPFDFQVRGTRVVCNPRGYARYDLTSDFRPDLVSSRSEIAAVQGLGG